MGYQRAMPIAELDVGAVDALSFAGGGCFDIFAAAHGKEEGSENEIGGV